MLRWTVTIVGVLMILIALPVMLGPDRLAAFSLLGVAYLLIWVVGGGRPAFSWAEVDGQGIRYRNWPRPEAMIAWEDIAEVRLRMRLRSRPVWTVEPRTGPPVRILASGWVLSAPQVTKLWNWLSTAGPGLEVQTSSGFGDNSARAVVLRRWEPDDISP